MRAILEKLLIGKKKLATYRKFNINIIGKKKGRMEIAVKLRNICSNSQ
jgi:hypothetical protein